MSFTSTPHPGADAFEEMNRKHFWVRIGKDDCIGREDDPTGVIFQRVSALYSEYANRYVEVGTNDKDQPQFKPLFKAWLESKSRRTYRQVVLAPPPCKADSRDYNLWQGFAIEPAEGDCSLFLAHLRDIICSGNDEHYAYLLNLLAFTIQEPGKPSQVAVVLRGKPGTGKGMFVHALGRIFGRRHYVQLDRIDHLVGNFNAALSGKILVFADEAFWAGDNKREIGVLKRLITEPTLQITRKGVDTSEEANHVHLFMATNEEWSVPAQMRERRFFALKVSDARIGDLPYFDRLGQSLDAGGLAAFFHQMLHRPIDRALIRRVPITQELLVQQAQSLPLVQQWWESCLFDGEIGELQWDSWEPVAELHKLYEKWVTPRTGQGQSLSINPFSEQMRGFLSAEGESKSVYNSRLKKSVRSLKLRTLEDARAYRDAQMNNAPAESAPWAAVPHGSAETDDEFDADQEWAAHCETQAAEYADYAAELEARQQL